MNEINELTTMLTNRRQNRMSATNSRFAKAGVSCFYDCEVLNSSFVLLLKFSAENRHLRVAAKRCTSYLINDIKRENGEVENRLE